MENIMEVNKVMEDKKFDVMEQLGTCGLVPVVVLDKPEDAEPLAEALLAGGIDIMEITMRTPAGLESIRRVRKAFPEMLVGAGTVLSVEKAQAVKEAGAQFVVTPGFNEEVVRWCLDNDLPVTPGCVTPSEIEQALSMGLKVLKYFPADIYGGVKGCKALYGPYQSEGIQFIPTGGVDLSNLSDFANQPFIQAVGGGFLCKPADVVAGNFKAITETAKKAVAIMLGFEFDHMGINEENPDRAAETASFFESNFGFSVKHGNSSNFAGPRVEVTKEPGLGTKGHIAVKTCSLKRAIRVLTRQGLEIDLETAKYHAGKMIAVYLKDEVSGFAVHLIEK